MCTACHASDRRTCENTHTHSRSAVRFSSADGLFTIDAVSLTSTCRGAISMCVCVCAFCCALSHKTHYSNSNRFRAHTGRCSPLAATARSEAPPLRRRVCVMVGTCARARGSHNLIYDQQIAHTQSQSLTFVHKACR